MRTNNYNDSSGRGGRYPKRQGSNNSGARRPSGRRPSGSGNGPTNASGMTSKRNKYLDMAKEALSSGNRVEAENYYQHAEHYSKMLSAAAATKRERDEASEHSQRRRNNNSVEQEKQTPVEEGADNSSSKKAPEPQENPNDQRNTTATDSAV